MNYQTNGFRPLYRQFSVFEMTNEFRELVSFDPNAAAANCILCYGYIDPMAGFTLEIIATGVKENDDCSFFEPVLTNRALLRAESFENLDYDIIEDENDEILDNYIAKLEPVSYYIGTDGLEILRDDEDLDPLRDPVFCDDLNVMLYRDGLKIEKVWVRVNDLIETNLVGTLLNEPVQDMGCHEDDEICFTANILENGKLVLFCDTNEPFLAEDVLEYEDLIIDELDEFDDEDEFDAEAYEELMAADFMPSYYDTTEGIDDEEAYELEMDIKAQVKEFTNEPAEETYFDTISLLLQAPVWIRCVGYTKNATSEMLEEALNYDGEKLLFVNEDDKEIIEFDPEIAHIMDEEAGEMNAFLPIFTSSDEIKAPGKGYELVKIYMDKALELAINSKPAIDYIALNPFSEEFLIPTDLAEELLAEIRAEDELIIAPEDNA